MPHFQAGSVHKSGGDSACLLVGGFFFGAETVFYFVAIFRATCLIEFVCALVDLCPSLPFARFAA